MSDRSVLRTVRAPEAIGPYSQAIRAGGFLFTAGQVGLDPDGGKRVEGSVREQTARAMGNLAAILEEAGMGFGNVVKATLFLTDLGDFTEVNEVYGSYFAGLDPPARSTVQVAALPLGARVEIEMIADGIRS